MKIAALVIGLLVVCAVGAYAQGPFADVPTDHWAYEAVNQLQQDGILIGYPDGTFGGKRAMTRYEFAVAVARMIPIIVEQARGTGGTGGCSQATCDDLNRRVTALEQAKPTQPPTGDYCTKADCDAIRRLVDEFRDELAALGVDVDALKRDVAALNDRVTALEKEVNRVRLFGELDAIGTAGDIDDGTPFDRDDRQITSSDMDENISVLENFNLRLRGALTDNVVANVMGVFGNYLDWIGAVDDYNVFTRPDSRFTGLGTRAALYYANIDWGLGNGKLTLGRFPIQWTPYTLKMIDVDSYSAISYTDSGDYPMDGVKFDWRLGDFKIDAFAAKNNEHDLLINGLTSQPTVGLYNDALGFGAPFHDAGGHAAGGLAFIDQSAGVRLQYTGGDRWGIGGSWMQAAGTDTRTPGGTPLAAVDFDSVDIIGADVNFGLGRFAIAGQWATTDTKGIGGVADIDDDSDAIDARVGFNIGKFGIEAGWKRVEHNFAAPGYWDKLGRWTNPVNIEGWFAGLNFGLTSSVSLVANAAFYEGEATVIGANAAMDDPGDEVNYYQAGLKWGLSSTNSVTLGVEWVNWDPSEGPEADEKYYTIGWAYQATPSSGFKLMYQIIDYDDDGGLLPYGADYEGNLAVAQFGVKF